MFASAKKLTALTVIVDNNNLQIDGSVEEVNSPYPIPEKFAAFGFNVIEICGHCFDEIEDAFEDDEDEEEPFAIFVEEKRNIFGKRKVISGEKRGMSRGFKIMILLEIIAILCIAIWWVVMQL